MTIPHEESRSYGGWNCPMFAGVSKLWFLAFCTVVSSRPRILAILWDSLPFQDSEMKFTQFLTSILWGHRSEVICLLAQTSFCCTAPSSGSRSTDRSPCFGNRQNPGARLDGATYNVLKKLGSAPKGGRTLSDVVRREDKPA